MKTRPAISTFKTATMINTEGIVNDNENRIIVINADKTINSAFKILLAAIIRDRRDTWLLFWINA